MILLSTPEGDIWKTIFASGLFNYAYTLVGKTVAGISSYLPALDAGGKLHLLLRLSGGRYIYAYWQGHCWKTIPLPYQDGHDPYGLVVDNIGRAHILFALEQGQVKHFFYQNEGWLIEDLPFPLPQKPLCFELQGLDNLFLCWEDINGEVKNLFFAIYTGGTGWSPPRLLGREKRETEVYVYRLDNSDIEWFAWEKQIEGYQIYYRANKNSSPKLLITELLGEISDLPDKYPILLSRGPETLLCWTAGGKFTFCLKDNGKGSWSKPQSDYLFFPACLQPVVGWRTVIRDRVAFTKICGIELEWPLILSIEQILPYCKAVLAMARDQNAASLVSQTNHTGSAGLSYPQFSLERPALAWKTE